jgi:hypothetical protein
MPQQNNTPLVFRRELERAAYDIARAVRGCPQRFESAGEWLDDHFGEDAIDGVDNKPSERWIAYQKNRQVGPVAFVQPPIEIRSSRHRRYYDRMQLAVWELTAAARQSQFLTNDLAAAVVLVAWILTDPDSMSSDLNLTEFENWQWPHYRKHLADKLYPPPVSEGPGNSEWELLTLRAWDRLKDMPSAPLTKPADVVDKWFTITQAAICSGKSKPEICKLADEGRSGRGRKGRPPIIDNGKSGRERRIDCSSVWRLQLAESERTPIDSDGDAATETQSNQKILVEDGWICIQCHREHARKPEQCANPNCLGEVFKPKKRQSR